MATLFLVFDRVSKEGVVFADYGDAVFAESGDDEEIQGIGVSTLAEEFREAYGETGDIVLHEIEVSDELFEGDVDDGD